MKFEELRENGQINISKGIETKLIIKDEEENKGARNKFWFNNYNYLFKEIYNDSNEDFAELIAEEIAKELNISCASYDLAIYNGKRGVITKNFVNEDNGDELISGSEVINEVYQKYILPLKAICNNYHQILKKYNFESDKIRALKELIELYNNSLINSNTLENIKNKRIEHFSNEQLDFYLNEFKIIISDLQQMYEDDFATWTNGVIKANNLFDLWSVIDLYCKINNYELSNSNEIIKKLTDLFIYDIILSQGDRHSDNWSLIVNEKNKSISFSPIYDNSNMCNLNRSKTIKTISLYIENLTNSKLNINKRKRINERLKDAIYHEKSSLKISPEDVTSKSNNIVMINEFIEQSSNEIIEEIKNIINKLNPDKIEEIFKRIESRIKIPIPNDIKLIVFKTIETNIEEIKKSINKSEVLQNGK